MKHDDTVGVILAGGKSSRMQGRDKFLLQLNEQTLLERTVEQALKQVSRVLICCNGDLSRLPELSSPCIQDSIGCYDGPLAGVLTALHWYQQQHPQAKWLATFPADATDFPTDWVEKCRNHIMAKPTAPVCAADEQGSHFTFALWPFTLEPTLRQEFASGTRALRSFFPHQENILHFNGPSPFTNINTVQEWQRYQQKHT